MKSSIVVLKTYTCILTQQSTFNLCYGLTVLPIYYERESQLKTLKINTQLYYNIEGFHLTHPRI